MGRLDKRRHQELLYAVRAAPFLFGSDVLKYIFEVQGEALKLNRVADEFKQRFEENARRYEEGKPLLSLPVTAAKLGALNSELGLMVFTKAHQVFSPYLQLYHERPWYSRLKAKVDRWMDSADVIMSARSDHQQQG